MKRPFQAKHLLLAAIIATVALSGCMQQDITPAASQLPEIKQFLEENPGSQITTLFMKADAVRVIIKDIRKDCGETMAIAPYWYITVSHENEFGEFYVDQGVQKVICTVREELQQQVEYECIKAADCDDEDPSTRNECKGSPRKCVYTPITACRNGDGYCPPGCGYQQDQDCPAIDLCQRDADCTDANRFTVDLCTGTPKYCKYELRGCEELGGYLCESYERCSGTGMPSKDSKLCCDQGCERTETCEGVTCPAEQKCVRGQCIDKTCGERELPLCTSDEVCTEELFKDDLGITCCTGECRKPCDYDAECSTGEVCRNDYCIAESCSDIGGKECDTQTEKCTGDKERTVDTDECCLECSLKTCEEMEGIECGEGTACSKATVQASDTGECCKYECTADTCIDRPCAINKKCVEGECVLKTCEEMEGIDWEVQATCQGSFYETSGITNCCLQKSCEELGGIGCLTSEACAGEEKLSTDTNHCCIGTCW